MAKKLKYNGSDEVVVKYALKDRHGVDIDISNLTAVAEGKCNTIVINYGTTISYIKGLLTNGTNVAKLTDGTNITQSVLNGDYDELVKNASFDSNNNSISLFQNNYLVSLEGQSFIFYRVGNNLTPGDFKTGDIIIVVETEVPDRWFSDLGYFYKLETNKIDLSALPTLSAENNFAVPQTFHSIRFMKDASTYFKHQVLSNKYQFFLPSGNVAYQIDSANGDLELLYNLKLQPSSNITDGTNSLTIADIPSKSGNNTFTGTNTFSNGLKIGQYNTISDLGGGSLLLQPILDLAIKTSCLRPYNSNSTDIGKTSHSFKDLYLVGSIKDGTNSVSVANIKATIGSVITNTTDTTLAHGLTSTITYQYTQPLTSIAIASLDVQNGDNNPIWDLIFTTGTLSAQPSFPSGITINWKGGTTPTFADSKTYEIMIRKVGTVYYGVASEL